jgi:hypothetical protein
MSMESVEEGRSCGSPAFKVGAALFARNLDSLSYSKNKEVAQTLSLLRHQRSKTTRWGEAE